MNYNSIFLRLRNIHPKHVKPSNKGYPLPRGMETSDTILVVATHR